MFPIENWKIKHLNLIHTDNLKIHINKTKTKQGNTFRIR